MSESSNGSPRDVGILPNDVVRDPRSGAFLVFITLADGIDEATMKSWLADVASRIRELEGHQGREVPYASAVFGLGQKFFARYPQYAANNPAGLGLNLDLPNPMPAVDAFVYVMATNEQRVADFLTALWRAHPTTVNAIDVERGYQRADKRESFGQLDGLRVPVSADRDEIVFIDRDVLPEEPTWLADGSYAVYMKIEQNLEGWRALDGATQEAVIGRRAADGSRLDLPAATNTRLEPDYSNPACPVVTSHVRKAGPRGPVNDMNQIMRRGVPYLEAKSGALSAGLQFVSFQATPAYFDVTFNHWMRNPDFPSSGVGQDDLITRGLLNFLKSGMYVIPPADDRYPAAGYFDIAPADPPRSKTGRIHVRKQVVDANGAPVRAEMGGIEIAVFDATTGQQVGESVFTNPAGHAMTQPIPLGTSVLVRELLGSDSRFQTPAEVPVVVDSRNEIVPIVNRLKPQVPAYGS